MTRLTWNIAPDLPPHKVVSLFEREVVEKWILDIAPPVIAAAVTSVTVEELSPGIAGGLRGSLTGGFDLLLDADTIRDPFGIYQFRATTHGLIGVATHEVSGHGTNNLGNSIGEKYFERFPFDDLYEVTYSRRSQHTITVEGFCELIRIALTTPAKFKARIPDSVRPFIQLWEEVAGGWPTAPDWQIGPAGYVAYQQFAEDDVTSLERAPIGLARQQGWETIWVWEHLKPGKFAGYNRTAHFLPGADQPIAEDAVLYRVADVPVRGRRAALRSPAVRAWRRHRPPPPPPTA